MLGDLIGSSPAIVAVREEVQRLLRRPAAGRSLPPILLQGETGTGKGLLAAAIHREGPRAAGPFVTVNCAAIPETLFEAEVFGFERGAFTDARHAKPGLIETAHGGTLFLDEIGLLPGPLHGKLLTVLEEGRVRRLGRTRSEPVDVAILAATSEDLQRAVREQRFSEALYFRLSVLTVRLPPLRERGADIILLAGHHLARAAADYGLPVRTLAPDAREALLAYAWPGNVRELRNLMERVTLVGPPGPIAAEMLRLTGGGSADIAGSPGAVYVPTAPHLRERLAGMERDTLLDVLVRTAGNITRAAAHLGVPPTTLRYRLRKYGLLGAAPPPPRGIPAGAAQAPSGAGATASAGTADLPSPHPWSGSEPGAASVTGCPAVPPDRPTPAPAAGRRQLTVMLCGLTVSGAPSTAGDRPDLNEAIHDARVECTAVIERFEGHVASSPGNGLLVYFGLPRAHEDDARRAVHTAIGIVDAMRRVTARLEGERGIRITARIGIHTGLVALGDIGWGEPEERVAAGDAAVVARELHQLAEADAVIVSSTTYGLIERYFVCEDLGVHALAALSAPLRVYRVVRPSSARERMDAVTLGLTPLVGREQELGILVDRWEQARDGRGQVVLLSGEAGIGKSRLVQALDERLAVEPHTRHACYGSPYHQTTALYPVIDMLQRRLQLEHADGPRDKADTIEAALQQAGLATGEAISVLAALLAPPGAADPARSVATPQELKQKTLDILLAWLLADAEQQLTLSVWEDVQWFDPSTLELLDLLLGEVPTARLLVVLTYRPEFARAWPSRSHLTHIALSRLSRAHAELMVANVARGRALAPGLVQQVVAKADGVPLFVEELTKMMLGFPAVPDAAGDALAAAIPSTLHDSLMARLDRLGSSRETVHLAAALGHDFSYAMLRAVSGLDEPSLRRELTRLVDAELLYRKGAPPEAQYSFKHALIQEAAYQSLSPARRREYHARIARELEGRLRPAVSDPELVAHHYTEAGLAAAAIACWHRAAHRAMERSASAEAIEHVRRGIALLESLPPTRERAGQELALQLTLGSALLMVKEYTAPEVERVYARADQLRAQVDDVPELFAALFGLWRFHISRADVLRAHELGRECFALARRHGNSAMLLQAHFALGASLLNRGEFAPALAELQHALDLCGAAPAGLAFLSGTDPAVACRCYMARARWLLGYPEQGRADAGDALDRARALAHAPTLGYAIHLASSVHTYRRELDVVQDLADRAIALANEHGFERWGAAALMRRGWVDAQRGGTLPGIAKIGEGLAVWGLQLGRTQFLALLVEAHLRAGAIDPGLRAVDEALVIARDLSERLYEAELYRLRGELLRQRATRAENDAPGHFAASSGMSSWPDDPEMCFREALAIARRQGARSLELRAATSLARLWQAAGKRTEPRQLLAEIHGWFTEGLDGPDWREAQALLDVLR